MEFNRKHFQAQIFHDFSVSTQLNIQRLHLALGNCASLRAAVFRWFIVFKRGKINLGDDRQSGRPQIAVFVKKHVEYSNDLRNSRFTNTVIENLLGITSGNFKIILTQ